MLHAEPRAERRSCVAVPALDDADRLARVLAAHPDLAAYGWKMRDDTIFAHSRAHLRTSVDEFERALAFLSDTPPIAAANSYGLKHLAERWCRERNPKQDSYISNGAMIAAVLALGLHCKRISGTPNSRISGRC